MNLLIHFVAVQKVIFEDHHFHTLFFLCVEMTIVYWCWQRGESLVEGGLKQYKEQKQILKLTL